MAACSVNARVEHHLVSSQFIFKSIFSSFFSFIHNSQQNMTKQLRSLSPRFVKSVNLGWIKTSTTDCNNSGLKKIIPQFDWLSIPRISWMKLLHMQTNDDSQKLHARKYLYHPFMYYLLKILSIIVSQNISIKKWFKNENIAFHYVTKLYDRRSTVSFAHKLIVKKIFSWDNVDFGTTSINIRMTSWSWKWILKYSNT